MTCCKLRPVLLLLALSALALASCRETQSAPPDHPRLNNQVSLQDVTFRSASLGRDMRYRVVLPKSVPPGKKLVVVYLLHGGGGGFRDWTNYSDVARLTGTDFILVMPEGDSSYYTNSAEHPEDRYEDYIVNDLIADVESRFPAAAGRDKRAIVGISMGGFGAAKLALKHPELFAFAAGLSAALDVPSRPFSPKRVEQWKHHSSIFGPWGSQIRHENDPFVLVRSADLAKTPYLFLTCGDQEGLLATNRKFARMLAERRFRYEFHIVHGDHNWNQWNPTLPLLFQSLSEHIAKD